MNKLYTKKENKMIDTENNTMLPSTDAARLLGVSTGTLRLWRLKGEGPVPYKIGNSFKYKKDEVINYINNCRVNKND